MDIARKPIGLRAISKNILLLLLFSSTHITWLTLLFLIQLYVGFTSKLNHIQDHLTCRGQLFYLQSSLTMHDTEKGAAVYSGLQADSFNHSFTFNIVLWCTKLGFNVLCLFVLLCTIRTDCCVLRTSGGLLSCPVLSSLDWTEFTLDELLVM